jgi:transposase InsO family protein
LKNESLGAGVQLDFIGTGKPVENAFRESFNGRLHSSLGHLTPAEFVGQRQVSRAAEEAVYSN